MKVVHGPGPWTRSTVHRVVHGPGPQGWSMDLGPCFVYVPFGALPEQKSDLSVNIEFKILFLKHVARILPVVDFFEAKMY